MPSPHDLDPDAMTDEERLAKKRYHAAFAFEMDGPVLSRAEHFQTGTAAGREQ